MMMMVSSIFLLLLVAFASSTIGITTDCSSSAISVDATIDGSSQPAAVCGHFQGVNQQSYLDWYDANNIESKYTAAAYFSGDNPNRPEDGVAVHWKISENEDGIDGDDFVYLAVAARAKGWLGFGIAEAGGMIGADMALFTAARPNELVDAYTLDERYPQIDDCQHDWELVASNVDAATATDAMDSDNLFIMFEARRRLDTKDHQDRVIVNDVSSLIPSHRIIAAWGDQAEVSGHGLKRARGAIRFFGLGNEQAAFDAAMTREPLQSLEIRANQFTIPPVDTKYGRFCFSRQDLIGLGLPDTQDEVHFVGFEPIVTPGSEAYVHHFIVYANPKNSCRKDDLEEPVYVWVPGEGPLALPDNLGIPIFGASGHQAFVLEIHYNNPLLDQNIVDRSGVRVYWTETLRSEQLGMLTVGDTRFTLGGQPIGSGLTVHEFACPESCSRFVLKQPVTVMREYLHMHQAGARMTNEQIRNGEVIRTGAIDFWEFNQNGNAAVQQDAFTIEPGDGFKTACYYSTQSGTVFGMSSQEEMCIAFMYYYPRATLHIIGKDYPWSCGVRLGFPTCDAKYTKLNLDGVGELGRSFGTKLNDSQCKPPVAEPTEALAQVPSVTTQKQTDASSVTLFYPMIWAILMLPSFLLWTHRHSRGWRDAMNWLQQSST